MNLNHSFLSPNISENFSCTLTLLNHDPLHGSTEFEKNSNSTHTHMFCWVRININCGLHTVGTEAKVIPCVVALGVCLALIRGYRDSNIALSNQVSVFTTEPTPYWYFVLTTDCKKKPNIIC